MTFTPKPDHLMPALLKKVAFDPPDEGDVCRLHPAGLTTPVVIDPLVGERIEQGVDQNF